MYIPMAIRACKTQCKYLIPCAGLFRDKLNKSPTHSHQLRAKASDPLSAPRFFSSLTFSYPSIRLTILNQSRSRLFNRQNPAYLIATIRPIQSTQSGLSNRRNLLHLDNEQRHYLIRQWLARLSLAQIANETQETYCLQLASRHSLGVRPSISLNTLQK